MRVAVRAKWFAAVAAVAVVGGLLYWGLVLTEPPLPEGVPREFYDLSAAQFREQYGRDPDRLDTLSWAAEAAVGQERWDVAAAAFAEIPSSHPKYGRQARYQEGQVLLQLNRARESEECFRELLRLEERDRTLPDRTLHNARQHLRFLLELQLRFEERHALLTQMLEDEQFDWFDVSAYCFPSLLGWSRVKSSDRAEAFLKQDPRNPLLRVAVGRYRTAQGRPDEARTILEGVRSERPDDLPAAAALLECLIEVQDAEAADRLVSSLPKASPDDPWLLLRLRGRIHNERREHDQAAQAFRMALTADPANPESNVGLAAAYAGLGEDRKRAAALERARVLGRIQSRLAEIQATPDDVEPLVEVVRMCREIGLPRHAAIVAHLAEVMAPSRRDVAALAEEVRSEIEGLTAP